MYIGGPLGFGLGGRHTCIHIYIAYGFGDWGKAHRVKGLQEGSQSLEYRAWGVGAQASASPAF